MLDRIVNLFGGRGYLLQPDAAEYIMRHDEPLAAAEGLAARLAASPSQGAKIVTLDLLKRLEVLEAGGLALNSPEAAVLVAHAEAQLAASESRARQSLGTITTMTGPVARTSPAGPRDATAADPSTQPVFDEAEGPFRHQIQVIQDTSREAATEGLVKDFVSLFRSRLERQREFLRRSADQRLITVEEAGREGNDVSFVAMVRSAKNTKFGTVALEVEDETGWVKVTVGGELAGTFDDIVDDEVLLFRARPSASRESGLVRRLSAREIHRPDLSIASPIRRGGESAVAFVSDIHIGSKTFMEKEWQRFVKWLGSGDELARRVRYIVAVGDVVDGIGIYPNQEEDLAVQSLHDQYRLLAEQFAEVRPDIKIVMMPGNHDAVRPAEPQPTFPASLRALFDRERFVFLSNPAMVKIEGTKILGYHGKSLDDMIAHIPGLSYQRPLEAMIQLLRRRHLAPIYGDKTPLAPLHDDRMVISETPDVFVCGHVHVAAMGEYQGIRVINAGAWQSQTSFQRSHNITPYAARVPILDLRTMDMKMPDFST